METKGIVAFAFGVDGKILPNLELAKIASDKAEELKAPVYTQSDIIIIRKGIEVVYIKEEPDNPPPTLRIARGAVKWAERQGITELWVAVARPHSWRAMRDMEEAVRETGAQIAVQICEEIYDVPASEWFCPDSTQTRTRSWWRFWPREAVLQLLPFWIYKRVAS
ncbi:hypothetical protein COT68_03365 [bacterium (Candidatus Torokbacteria) CG09_land_8_20_14_0_10_42_11]|nr:MAG: hypothetical protein COT68_03365 [bacterium (Candidatus Torokbacteria) CG09_land_8_20_14_0_10_42_11]